MKIEVDLSNMVVKVYKNSDYKHEKINITNLFDKNGNECNEMKCVAGVAGPCSEGFWYSFEASPSFKRRDMVVSNAMSKMEIGDVLYIHNYVGNIEEIIEKKH